MCLIYFDHIHPLLPFLAPLPSLFISFFFPRNPYFCFDALCDLVNFIRVVYRMWVRVCLQEHVHISVAAPLKKMPLSSSLTIITV